MFNSQVVFTLLALMTWSVITREVSLFLMSLALLLAASVSLLWERYCLVRIEYRRHFSRRRAAFGEEVELEIEVVNRKLLPLSWMETEDEVPQCLPPAHGRISPSHKPGRAILANLFALRPYERVRRRYTLPCHTRGEHLFGPVRLRSGDFFGFVTCEETLKQEDCLIVYPRVVPLSRLGLPARHPLGDLRAQSWLFEDVTRVAGAREYRPGDSLRRIHWPASARTQQLQTRVYEATTSFKLGVFLNVGTHDNPLFEYGYDPEVLELTITAAASIANWGLERGHQVGLYTNGLHRGVWGKVVVEPGCDTGQLEKVLLALARLQPVAAERFDALLAAESRRLPFGTTVVAVTPALHPPAAAEMLALRARGHAVTVVLTGREGVAAPTPGVVVRRVGPPEDWKEMPVLAPVGANGHGR